LSQDGRVLIVRATKKLLDRIGPPSLGEGEHSTTSTGQWYATALFWKPLLPLPARADDMAIAKAAARHGICLAPLSPIHLAPSPTRSCCSAPAGWPSTAFPEPSAHSRPAHGNQAI
jgi:hypothetical protein